ncbi:MAG: class I SAM-dependent methyltransferase [Planctomycetota bacterium]|nr:class I SAM-dependent methyltransferase [Planctomycetota bacterium]
MSAQIGEGPGRPDDPYSRAAYRKLIAWDRRIAREEPFLRRCLGAGTSVLDLGCGTGEHVAWFARSGWRAVGLDRSETMIEAAREHEARGEGRFVLGDALSPQAALPEEPPFDLALCLGNMLPHVLDDAELASFVRGAAAVLAPGGRLLVQILNYAKLLSDDVTALPVNVRRGDGEERIVFLRLMARAPHGRVLFFPTTLTLDVDAEEPLHVHTTRRVELRAWSAEQLTHVFESAAFHVEQFGDMEGGAYDPAASHDLVVLATRPS